MLRTVVAGVLLLFLWELKVRLDRLIFFANFGEWSCRDSPENLNDVILRNWTCI